jgi:hypothetical protein
MTMDIVDLKGVLGPSAARAVPQGVSAKVAALGLTMLRTCTAAPEQYEFFRGGEPAGYVRVRWSGFTVEYPTAGEETLHNGRVDGFAAFSDAEREGCLLIAIDLIAKRMDIA